MWRDVGPNCRASGGLPSYFGSSARITGSSSIIGSAASHLRSKGASNFDAAPASWITIRSLSSIEDSERLNLPNNFPHQDGPPDARTLIL